MMNWVGGSGWSPWLFLSLFWLALLAVVGVLALRMLRPQTRSRHASNAEAGYVLDQMFARGEIDEQTYRTRRSALTSLWRPE